MWQFVEIFFELTAKFQVKRLFNIFKTLKYN